MKINELKETVLKYSEKDLQEIIFQMYKTIPKKIKEEKGFDNFIKNPELLRQPEKRILKEIKLPDIEELKFEIENFIEYAYKQYYFAPNSYVHKKDRPKWRFIVKKFYKELILSLGKEENIKQCAELLEKLYIMLCYACDYTFLAHTIHLVR